VEIRKHQSFRYQQALPRRQAGTQLFKFINSGGLSNPHENILTDETPFLSADRQAFIGFVSLLFPN